MTPRKRKTVETSGRRGGKTLAMDAIVAEALSEGVAIHAPTVNPVPDETWSVAQVASHMGLSYQTARNQMLSGVFGQSHYDPAKRRLTVSANRVKTVKTMKTKKRTKKRRRTA